MDELNLVALTRDVPEVGLAAGDIGTVVFRYPNGKRFEVEFVTAEGKTLAVLTLAEGDVRELTGGEILHARAITRP
ncbi:MAG: DUF4926 domain-containing protein [Gemmatimonadetes bacterium]|nr:DUF4926 domain-containing protein [Gemmatimonadota bacterium]NNM04032.1 DUF4926 domain-containing protein [Gemmatimonadota bacterium]